MGPMNGGDRQMEYDQEQDHDVRQTNGGDGLDGPLRRVRHRAHIVALFLSECIFSDINTILKLSSPDARCQL
ncbi:uncharacterized protein A4U43_C01F2340 [Asparagus officinalis]|uniref:Uncharacterized protein n=1 Tax=Asparagus officinalis TaxID=4686 RepID=A0A5P1FLE1_ASPOF|nr:uncharacterized protein A4U43_C01F2340 [Asparagus officinalis]